MSYVPAFTSCFYSSGNKTQWAFHILINNYTGVNTELDLDADQPVVIEWPQTGKTDAVQSSVCTIKVVNRSDRQLLPLMKCRDALLRVYRNDFLFWQGLQDDAVYEEPYSYSYGYVTELTFSDFGFLNRSLFDLSGKQSVRDVVDDCLHAAGLNNLPFLQLISLYSSKTTVVSLDDIYVCCDRFDTGGKSSPSKTTKMDVLESLLKPLGLKIVQRNGRIIVYDIEYLKNEINVTTPIVWKGDDAYLRGSETYEKWEIDFDTGTENELIDDGGMVDPDDWSYSYDDIHFAPYYDPDDTSTPFNSLDAGFYFDHVSINGPSSSGRLSRLRAVMSSCDEVCYAIRAKCRNANHPTNYDDLIASSTPNYTSQVSRMLMFHTGYLPLIPDPGLFQLRINLDILFSPKRNPFEPVEYDTYSPQTAGLEWNCPAANGAVDWDSWKDNMLRVFVPVKLEVVDESGNVLYHYMNTQGNGDADLYPMRPGKGMWLTGAAGWKDMMLSYYKDGLEETPLDGWAGNRMTVSKGQKRAPGIYKKRKDGEYVPLPPVAGCLRLSISNGITAADGSTLQVLLNFDGSIHWQLYRVPKVTLVRAMKIADDVNDDDVIETLGPISIYDCLIDSVRFGSYRKGVAPTARGLFFYSDGSVCTTFSKAGLSGTLEYIRAQCLKQQTEGVMPELSGTAEINSEFCLHEEASTPGKFMVTALRQDLRSDTEHVTVSMISDSV